MREAECRPNEPIRGMWSGARTIGAEQETGESLSGGHGRAAEPFEGGCCERIQYANSPGFGASSDWREARWPVEIEPGGASVQVILRNTGPGTVYWDEFQVAMQ